MNITLNALSAKRGGAVTYLQNILPEMAAALDDGRGHRVVVWRGVASTAERVWPETFEYRQDDQASGGVGAVGGSWGRRMWFDQVRLPRLLRAEGADVLYSTANFGAWRSPCRQVLQLTNAAYFDEFFLGRMPSAKVRTFFTFQRWLTLASVKTADLVLFPSQALLDITAKWTGGPRPGWSGRMNGHSIG